jgi:hypothetical protein
VTRSRMTKAAVAAGAALALAVGGTALAAGGDGSTGPSAFLDSVAKHLGISSEKLQDATRAAAIDQVDARLKAGTITQAQADEMKQRIESGDGLGLGGLFMGRGHGHGPGGPAGHLDDAAAYLGLTAAELRTKLQAGSTLAEVAKAEGKTVAGLKAALLASEKKELDAAVASGRLTQAQADEILADAGTRFDDMINGTMPQGGPRGHGPGGHGMFGSGSGAGSGAGTSSTGSF